MISVSEHGNRRRFSEPRSVVRINGREVWFNSWTVNLNDTTQADDFSVELPFRIVDSLQGDSPYLLQAPDEASQLLVQAELVVEIFVGFQPDIKPYVEASDLQRLMYGIVDTVEVAGSPGGERVSLTGRNMVAKLLDRKTNEKFPNLTASQIAELMAQRNRLLARVIPTYTAVGAYANEESIELSNDSQSEWDLLTHLADQEGYIVCVLGDTLYFGPLDGLLEEDQQEEPLAYTWGQNVLDFSITRNPHAGKNLLVEVHSYNAAQAKHVLATAGREFPGADKDSIYKERHFVAGLNQQQAQARADGVLQQLTLMELIGTLRVTGDSRLRVGRRLALYGVGHVLSDVYYIRKASHTFSASDGYRANLSISTRLLGGTS